MASLNASLNHFDEGVTVGKIRSIRPHFEVFKMHLYRVKDPYLNKSVSSFSYLPHDPRHEEQSKQGSVTSAKSNLLQVSSKSTIEENVVAGFIPVYRYDALARTKPMGRHVQMPRSYSGLFNNNTSIYTSNSKPHINIFPHPIPHQPEPSKHTLDAAAAVEKISNKVTPTKKPTLTGQQQKRVATRSTAVGTGLTTGVGTGPNGTLGALVPYNNKAFAARPSLETGYIILAARDTEGRRSLLEECNDTVSNGVSDNNNNLGDNLSNLRKPSSRSQLSFMQDGKSNDNPGTDLSQARAVYMKYAPDEQRRIMDINEETSSPKVDSHIRDLRDPDEAFNVDLISAQQIQESDKRFESRSKDMKMPQFNFENSLSDSGKLGVQEDDRLGSNYSDILQGHRLSRFSRLSNVEVTAGKNSYISQHLAHNSMNSQKENEQIRNHTLAINFEELRQLSEVLERQQQSSSDGNERSINSLLNE